MSLWPIRFKPNTDELLSSWITRISNAYSLTPSAFCKFSFPELKISFKEIDHLYSQELFSAIAKGTGIEIAEVWQTSLLSDEGYLFPLPQHGDINWVLIANNPNIGSTKGLAYCPQCLASDIEPYYRKSWRFILNPVCPVHKVFLSQGCPKCHKSYFFSKPFGKSSTYKPFTTCFNCGNDLINSKQSVSISELVARTLEIQDILNEGLLKDTFDIPGHGPVHAITYFSVLYDLMCLLRNPELAIWVFNQYRTGLPSDVFIKNRDWSFLIDCLEELPTEDIAIILCMASHLMGDWPNRYIDLFRTDFPLLTKIRRHNMPYWVVATTEYQLRYTSNLPIKKEIQSAKALLRIKLGRNPSINELKLFMSDGTVESFVRISKIKQREDLFSSENFKLGEMPEIPHMKKNADDVRKLINLDAAELKKYYALNKTKKEKKEQKDSQLNLFVEK